MTKQEVVDMKLRKGDVIVVIYSEPRGIIKCEGTINTLTPSYMFVSDVSINGVYQEYTGFSVSLHHLQGIVGIVKKSTTTEDSCQCGAHKGSGAPRGNATHSRWCSWST